MNMNNALENLTNAGANFINAAAQNSEIVKEVYDNGVSPAVKEAGIALAEPVKGIARIGRILNALWSSVDCWVLNREYAIKETQLMLEKKLSDISEEKIKAPENYIAIPALQALSYSMDSEELRELYANLLAKSMYSDTSDGVHPAYVEIIKQLSPLDIKIFNHIATNKRAIAVKEAYIHNKEKHANLYFITILTNFSFADIYFISSSLSNLMRCGLLSYYGELSDKKLYCDIDTNELVKQWCNKTNKVIENPDKEKLCFDNKSLSVTPLGLSFYDICCTEID